MNGISKQQSVTLKPMLTAKSRQSSLFNIQKRKSTNLLPKPNPFQKGIKANLPRLLSGCDLSEDVTPPQLPKKEIMILLESIYGESPELILASVDVMLANHTVVPVKDIRLIVPNSDSRNLKNLLDRSMMKTEDECFHHPWEGVPVGIMLEIHTDKQPTLFRIFNSTEGFDGHVEKFSVYVDKKCICTESIPADYGKHVSIRTVAIEPNPNNIIFLNDNLNKDPMFPIVSSYTVQIELLRNFDGKSDVFGVNCFEIVKHDGKRVKSENIEMITLDNCTLSNTPMSLLERKSKSNYIIIKTLEGKSKPSMKFTFKKPVRVAFVRVISYIAAEAKQTAISRVKITCGGRVTKYSGCVTSNSHGSDNYVKTTDIYFVDKVALKWADLSSDERQELSVFGPFVH